MSIFAVNFPWPIRIPNLAAHQNPLPTRISGMPTRRRARKKSDRRVTPPIASPLAVLIPIETFRMSRLGCGRRKTLFPNRQKTSRSTFRSRHPCPACCIPFQRLWYDGNCRTKPVHRHPACGGQAACGTSTHRVKARQLLSFSFLAVLQPSLPVTSD